MESEDYNRALAGEGEYWDEFIARRLLAGEMPGSIDWRLSFTQFRYNHDWRPFALGREVVNFRMREIRYLLETAVPRPSVRVLDLGCGAGWLSLEMARRGAHVTALDISPTNLALGRYMAETNARNFPFLYQRFAGLPCRLEDFGSVEYQYADLNSVDLPPAEYDAVIVWDSLHHIAELERLLEQVRSTLKPGGIFLGVDHSLPTTFTLEFDSLVMGWLDKFYAWVTAEDPRWLYEAVNEAARRVDWGPLSVDYDSTPVPGFGEFSKQLFMEMLDIVRSNRQVEAQVSAGTVDEASEESPFEDVSAERLIRSLHSSFTTVRFNTICPLVDPQAHIPHYRSEEERIFQHYLGCALAAAGREAIVQRHTDGMWFLFHMTPERPSSERAGDIESRIAETIKSIHATREISDHLEKKNAYISELESELERKNLALAELEKQLRQREQELIEAREPKLPWKRHKRP